MTLGGGKFAVIVAGQSLGAVGPVDALSEHRRGPHALTALLSVCLVRSARNRTSACIALLTLNQRTAFP